MFCVLLNLHVNLWILPVLKCNSKFAELNKCFSLLQNLNLASCYMINCKYIKSVSFKYSYLIKVYSDHQQLCRFIYRFFMYNVKELYCFFFYIFFRVFWNTVKNVKVIYKNNRGKLLFYHLFLVPLLPDIFCFFWQDGFTVYFLIRSKTLKLQNRKLTRKTGNKKMFFTQKDIVYP